MLVAAEMIGAKAGLGYLIIYAQYNFQIPNMYVGILSLTVIGLAFQQDCCNRSSAGSRQSRPGRMRDAAVCASVFFSGQMYRFAI